MVRARRVEIEELLQRAGIRLPCPRCGSSVFAVPGEHEFVIEAVPHRHEKIQREERLIRAVAEVCQRRGYIAQHDLSVLQRYGE